jgi:hypothetical protein
VGLAEGKGTTTPLPFHKSDKVESEESKSSVLLLDQVREEVAVAVAKTYRGSNPAGARALIEQNKAHGKGNVLESREGN